jgi:hypothetical protein
MSYIKVNLMEIQQCSFCNSMGWLSFDSGDGTPDYEACTCNPHEITREELEVYLPE